jgi:hypothetical protein
MARYDSSRRRWRHLDFGACQVWLEADIHRDILVAFDGWRSSSAVGFAG